MGFRVTWLSFYWHYWLTFCIIFKALFESMDLRQEYDWSGQPSPGHWITLHLHPVTQPCLPSSSLPSLIKFSAHFARLWDILERKSVSRCFTIVTSGVDIRVLNKQTGRHVRFTDRVTFLNSGPQVSMKSVFMDGDGDDTRRRRIMQMARLRLLFADTRY